MKSYTHPEVRVPQNNCISWSLCFFLKPSHLAVDSTKTACSTSTCLLTQLNGMNGKPSGSGLGGLPMVSKHLPKHYLDSSLVVQQTLQEQGSVGKAATLSCINPSHYDPLCSFIYRFKMFQSWRLVWELHRGTKCISLPEDLECSIRRLGGSWGAVWIFVFPMKGGAIRSYQEFPKHIL